MSELLTATEAQARLGLPSSWRGVPLVWAMRDGELPTVTISRHPSGHRPTQYVTEEDAREWLYRRHYVEGDPKCLPGYWVQQLAPELWDLCLKLAGECKKLQAEDSRRFPDIGARLAGTPLRQGLDDWALATAAELPELLEERERDTFEPMLRSIYEEQRRR